MALSNSDIQQIETIVRNEVRDFLRFKYYKTI